MRAIGSRKQAPLTFNASAELLREGARFNDEIHRLPTGDRTFIAKGVYRFRTPDDANRDDLDRVAAGMARHALVRV